jgi:hypothetical protein
MACSQRCDRQLYWDSLASLDIDVREKPAIHDISLPSPAPGQLSNVVGDSSGGASHSTGLSLSHHRSFKKPR